MSLQNASLLEGATMAAATGGSAIAFALTGVSVVNGVNISVPLDADFRTRRNITVKNKQPSLLSDGTYTKNKQSASFVQPKILADGSTVFNLIRIEREVHPESSAAEALELNTIGSQMLQDADFTSFWAGGSLS